MLKASCARTSYRACTVCSLPPGPSPASPKPPPCTKGAPSSRQPPSLLTSHLPPSCLFVSGCTGHFHPRSFHPGPVCLHACPLPPRPLSLLRPPWDPTPTPHPPWFFLPSAPSPELGVFRAPSPSPDPLPGCSGYGFTLHPPPHLCCPFSGPRPLPECWSSLQGHPLLPLNDSSVSLSKMLCFLPKHGSPSNYVTVVLRLLFNLQPLYVKFTRAGI